jgi:hypothetical protein
MATAQTSVGIAVTDNANAALGTYTGSPGISGGTSFVSTQITTGIYQGTATITSPTTFVTNNASLKNAYGNTLTYTTIQSVVVSNLSASASLVVGGGSNPLFGSDSYTIKPGQVLVIPNVPITVSSTVNAITLTPSASLTYQIIIVG